MMDFACKQLHFLKNDPSYDSTQHFEDDISLKKVTVTIVDLGIMVWYSISQVKIASAKKYSAKKWLPVVVKEEVVFGENSV